MEMLISRSRLAYLTLYYYKEHLFAATDTQLKAALWRYYLVRFRRHHKLKFGMVIIKRMVSYSNLAFLLSIYIIRFWPKTPNK